MELSRAEVEHIAALARLGLTDSEKELYAVQLSDILDHFQSLQKLDTEAVEPTTTAIPLQNVMKEDQVSPSSPPEDILYNAPDAIDGFFRVRAVLE